MTTASNAVENAVGTFGFTNNKSEYCPRKKVYVEHVFPHGLLMVHGTMKRGHAIVRETDFTPSREAYFSLGSYVEPEWLGESCICTNIWSGEDHSTVLARTDEQALSIAGSTWDEVKKHFGIE